MARTSADPPTKRVFNLFFIGYLAFTLLSPICVQLQSFAIKLEDWLRNFVCEISLFTILVVRRKVAKTLKCCEKHLQQNWGRVFVPLIHCRYQLLQHHSLRRTPVFLK